MKLIRKFLFLFVLLSFGGCIAMEEIQKGKQESLERKKNFLEKKKNFQDKINEIDLKLQTETNIAERERLLAIRKIKIDFELPGLNSLEATIKSSEEFYETLEMQEQINQQQAEQRLAKSEKKAKNGKLRLKSSIEKRWRKLTVRQN